MKQVGTVLALGSLCLAALALWMSSDPDAVRPVAVWTARLTLLLFVAAFLVLGRRAAVVARKAARRAAAWAMCLHLLAILRLAQLVGEAPLTFDSALAALVSLGGLAAVVVVLAGWPFWDRPWYRWIVYWPWAVFLFTYIVLSRHGEEEGRVVAAPLVFVPVVVLLVTALAWRVYVDWTTVKTAASW